jgi:hypothetical protein
VLSVFVTAASQTEPEAERARRVFRRKKRNKTGGKVVLQRLKEKGKRIARLHTIWVDGGFTGDTFMMWVMDICRFQTASKNQIGRAIRSSGRISTTKTDRTINYDPDLDRSSV